jgi:hypothetical protein
MDCQGQVVVANYLANMSKKGIKGATDTELEYEILKFFKKSLSNKVSQTSAVVQRRAHDSPVPSTRCKSLKLFTDYATRSHRPTSQLGN